MSGIPTPAAIGDAPAGSRPLVEAVKKQLGVVPNLFRLVSNSPAALQGYLGLSSALSKGALPAATRERIALAVAIGFPAVASGQNEYCDYPGGPVWHCWEDVRCSAK